MISSIISIQSPAVPSKNALVASDGLVFTLQAGEVGFIQNMAAAALFIGLGQTPNGTTVVHAMLKACGTAADGTGGMAIVDDFIGSVYVAAASGTASMIAWKRDLKAIA